MRKETILMLIGCLLLFSGCKHKNTEKETISIVKVYTVQAYGERKQITFPGKVKAASDMNIAFRISGPISKIYVDAGNQVKKGQILAEIDSRDYAVQLAATEAEYKQIKAEAERIIALYEKGSVSPNDYDKAVYGLSQITAKYDAHKNAFSDTKLLAPSDGYIQKRFFEQGETVSAGMPVLSMISSGNGEIEINIPSSTYIQRDNFDSYYCTSDIFPNKNFSLELIGITPKANINQLYTTRFKIIEKEENIPGPGTSVMVTILYKPEQAIAVSIPLTSVFESDNRSMVWVYDSKTETVSAREVKLSQIRTNGMAIISSGLSHGEIVVSAGVNTLKSGQKVNLLPLASPTNIGGML